MLLGTAFSNIKSIASAIYYAPPIYRYAAPILIAAKTTSMPLQFFTSDNKLNFVMEWARGVGFVVKEASTRIQNIKYISNIKFISNFIEAVQPLIKGVSGVVALKGAAEIFVYNDIIQGSIDVMHAAILYGGSYSTTLMYYYPFVIAGSMVAKSFSHYFSDDPNDKKDHFTDSVTPMELSNATSVNAGYFSIGLVSGISIAGVASYCLTHNCLSLVGY